MQVVGKFISIIEGKDNMVKRYNKKQIQEIAKILNNDGVISVPTDTVYGICSKINSERAWVNLIKLKNRPKNKAFSVMCADEEQIRSIAIIDEKAELLIHNFMPGPITLVLKKRNELPDYVGNSDGTVAIRMATSQELKELIQNVNCPIFMSSANKSGENVCKNLDEIEKTFPNLDGMLEGTVSWNIPSTIVDCSTEKIKILRSGPISSKQILAI